MEKFNQITYYSSRFRIKIPYHNRIIFSLFPEILFILECNYCQCKSYRTFVSDEVVKNLDLHQGLNILSHYTFNLNKNIISEVIKT